LESGDILKIFEARRGDQEERGVVRVFHDERCAVNAGCSTRRAHHETRLIPQSIFAQLAVQYDPRRKLRRSGGICSVRSVIGRFPRSYERERVDISGRSDFRPDVRTRERDGEADLARPVGR